MKQTFVMSLVIIGSFIAGVSGSLFTASEIVNMASQNIEDDNELLSPLTKNNYHEEFILSVTTENIKLIKSNQIKEFYRKNCFILEFQLKALIPKAVAVKHRKEIVTDKIVEARKLLFSMEKEGLCNSKIS